MVRTADARLRAAFISTCLCLSLSAGLATVAVGADVVAGPEDAGTEGATSPAALAGPWTEVQLDGAEAIASGHGRFVAVGATGDPASATAWSSVDGLEWDLADVEGAPVGSSLYQVAATDDGFVALGAESGVYGSGQERIRAWYSPDGQTWQPANVKRPGRSGLQAVASALTDGPAGQLALGSFVGQDLGGQRLWRSKDGRNWSPAKLPEVKDPVWDAVVSYPKGYLLLGQSGLGKPSNWKSVDGKTWVELKGTPRMFDVAASDSGALAGIGYKHIYESPRGVRSWEKAMTRPRSWNAGGSNAFAFVEWDGSEFVAPGQDFSACGEGTDECHTNPLLVSVDGKVWAEVAGPDGVPGADASTWITDVASLDGFTAVLGVHEGQTVIWLIDGSSAAL